jgi:hypothetical protein
MTFTTKVWPEILKRFKPTYHKSAREIAALAFNAGRNEVLEAQGEFAESLVNLASQTNRLNIANNGLETLLTHVRDLCEMPDDIPRSSYANQVRIRDSLNRLVDQWSHVKGDWKPSTERSAQAEVDRLSDELAANHERLKMTPADVAGEKRGYERCDDQLSDCVLPRGHKGPHNDYATPVQIEQAMLEIATKTEGWERVKVEGEFPVRRSTHPIVSDLMEVSARISRIAGDLLAAEEARREKEAQAQQEANASQEAADGS